MSIRRGLFMLVVIAGLFARCGAALAAPTGCAAGNQDNTCIGALANAPETPPTCPTSAGWTTTAAATWIGSQYSSPSCNYQAPPSCPSGDTQAGPVWNGSSWVDLTCTPPVEATPPTLQASVQACWASENAVQGSTNATFTSDSANGLTYYNVTGLAASAAAIGYGTVSNFDAASEYQAMLLADTGISGGGCNQTIQESGGAPPSGQISVISILWKSGATSNMCYLQAGTTNVLGTSSWACSAGHG
jgi:hypothetical protein